MGFQLRDGVAGDNFFLQIFFICYTHFCHSLFVTKFVTVLDDFDCICQMMKRQIKLGMLEQCVTFEYKERYGMS